MSIFPEGKKGFTLIELIIVIAILGILAAIAVPSYIGQKRNAARSEAYTNLQNLRLLEEQFMAENGRYTINLGNAGTSAATRDANLDLIQDTANDADIDELRGFRPGAGTLFSYRIVQNFRVDTPITNPPTWATAQNPCFVAIASGVDNTPVAGELFAIDCNNNRNF